MPHPESADWDGADEGARGQNMLYCNTGFEAMAECTRILGMGYNEIETLCSNAKAGVWNKNIHAYIYS